MARKETQDFKKRNYEQNEQKRKTFGKYTIQWIIAIPQKGKATLRDSKKSGMIGSTQVLFKHFPNKDKSEEFIKKLMVNKSFYKPYNLYTITDAQFGKIGFFTKERVLEVMTTKQKKDMRIIGKKCIFAAESNPQ